MIAVRWSRALLVLAACSQDRIEVSSDPSNDYNQQGLHAGVEKFVTSGRSAQAYGELARTVFALRAGMDRSTAEDAELKLVVLALVPMKRFADKPIDEQIDNLALTVWPALLADEIEADDILRKRDDAKSAEILPRKDEAARPYLERLCGKQLAAECKPIVPEFRGYIVSAVAIARATERARIAVADCLLCSTDKGWADAVRGWEELDQQAHATRADFERRADPANWPIAGGASLPDPGLPFAEVNPTGEVVIAGKRHGSPKERIAALAELRKGGGAIALHLRPDLSLATVRGILADTRKAGAKQIAVLARGAFYPWESRIYWVSGETGNRVGLRQTDTLQLLLHSIDHLGPGAVARVD